MNPGIEKVMSVLEDVGFESLPKPMVVAGAAFDFDGAMVGTGVSHDLVLIVVNPASSQRFVRLVAGLSLALDQAKSPRPVTIVVVGGQPDLDVMTKLERHARILTIDGADPSVDAIKTAVAILIPLTLPTTTSLGADPLSEVSEILGQRISDEHRNLIEAARLGPTEVRESLRIFVDEAVQRIGDES